MIGQGSRNTSGVMPRPETGWQGGSDDPVNHPSHYCTAENGIECIDAIEAALDPDEFAGFCRGNAIKYLWRAGRKGDVVEDLKKAEWYLRREIGARS